MLACVNHLDRKAVVVFDGMSLCNKCLLKRKDEHLLYTKLFTEKLSHVVGSDTLILKYLKFLANSINKKDLTIKAKYDTISKLDELAYKCNASKKQMNQALGLAMKHNQSKFSYVYVTLRRLTGADKHDDGIEEQTLSYDM